MTDEAPRPLKSAGETPEALVRALRALGRSDRDSARLTRVAARLGTKIAASGATPTASWLSKLIGTKTGLTTLFLGFAALGVLGYALINHPRAAETLAAPSSVVATPTPANAPAQAPTPQAEPSARPPTAPAQDNPRTHSAHATTRFHATADQAPPGEAPANAPARDEVAPSVANAAQSQPKPAPSASTAEQPSPKPAAAPTASAAQASELTLLHTARSLAVKQPAQALSLLREHAQRFPNGMLSPEREVLTIEVLKRLGRTADAAQRLQRFKAEYPNSIYLRRLQAGAGD